jgi:hypothetical protein
VAALFADAEAARLLAANDFVYRRLLGEVERLRSRNDARLLPFIELVARFAWEAHPGRLADGALDNILLEIGQGLAEAPAMAAAGTVRAVPGTSRTLHVASELYVTGGHSRVLAKWVQRDLSSSHHIVVTRQPGDLPPFLTAIAAERGALLTILDRSQSIERRAAQLRAVSGGFDRVILHHHPDDAVPVLAYAQAGGSPVAMFNHAHFWFSFGSGVSDMTINTMPYFRMLTRQGRFAEVTDLLDGPFGLDRLSWSDINKEQAKRRLGLSPDRPVAMTIGTEGYFTPTDDLDFFATLTKLLTARPELQVIIVGVREESSLVPPHVRALTQVRLVGPVPDPRPYYEAADVCLESFPMPSLGALMEAVAYGEAFPVPAFAEAEGPLRVNQERIASIAVRQRDEGAYLRYIGELLDARAVTRARAAELRHTLVEDDERFGDQFPGLYERLARREHLPRALPLTVCATASENVALASLGTRGVGAASLDALPLPSAIAAHVQAAVLGHEGPSTAMARIARRTARPIFSRLPEAVRRLLRSG